MGQKTIIHKEKLETRRSLVRIVVTYFAATFIFVGGLIVLIGSWAGKIAGGDLNAAKELYLTILPIATTVVTYWFASRKPSGNDDSTTPP